LILEIIFVNLFNKNVTKLYNKYAVLDYSKESMKFTNKIRIKTKLDYKDNLVLLVLKMLIE